MKKLLTAFLLILLTSTCILAYLKFHEANELALENKIVRSETFTLEIKIDSLKIINSRLEKTVESCSSLVAKIVEDYETLLLECKGSRKK